MENKSETYHFKRKILFQLFLCIIFISILMSVYIVYVAEDSLSINTNERDLRIVLAMIPLILTHVPWSAIRWSHKSKELGASENYDFFNALIDSAFLISVFISCGFLFNLFEIYFFLLTTIIALTFFIVVALNILFFSPNY